MDYNLLAQDNKFHDWAKLEPVATDYTKYAETDPSIIAAAHKIVDVYSAFASAKQSLGRLDTKIMVTSVVMMKYK